MTSKELVRRATHFGGPPRIPLSYPYDLKVAYRSDREEQRQEDDIHGRLRKEHKE